MDKTKVDEGAKNLMKANKLIKPNNQVQNPSFLAVLIGDKIAHARKDGIKFIQISCLIYEFGFN